MKTMKFRTMLLFGAPGSGKGTQGKILGSIPNFYHFSCGEVVPQPDAGHELGKIFLDYSSRGQLVPDEPTIRLWQHNIQSAEHDGRFNRKTDTLVLDGIPRNLRQARMLRTSGECPSCFLPPLRGHEKAGGPAATPGLARKPPR
jgi:adenylate kinase